MSGKAKNAQRRGELRAKDAPTDSAPWHKCKHPPCHEMTKSLFCIKCSMQIGAFIVTTPKSQRKTRN